MTSRIGLLLGILALVGCQSPWYRSPAIYPGDPAAERASYSQHDPLPDNSLGPNVEGRPRDAYTQRSEPRRSIEAAIPVMTGGPNFPGRAPQMMPPPASSYPNSITP